MNFYDKIQFFTGAVSKNVISLLRLNKFSSFASLKAKMNAEKLEKLFRNFEMSVRSLPDNSRDIADFEIVDGSSYKDFSLSIAEKNEITAIFDIMSMITFNDFNSVNKDDDISKTLQDLTVKVREDPSLIDSVRQIINPRKLPIFNELLNKSALTYQKGSTGNVYDPILKKFASLLYMKAGRKAYKCLQMNSTLPSASTCVHNIQEHYGGLQLGKVYAKELKDFLIRHNLPKIVCVSEDATRVKASIKYDPRTKEIIGLTAPYDNNGFPDHLSFKIDTPEEVARLVKNSKRAHFVQVVIAKPLCNGPSFVLAVYPTNNDYSAVDTESRWKKIYEELAKEGIEVVAFSTDGAPSLLSGMKFLLDFGKRVHKFLDMEFLYNIEGWYGCVQDIVHLLNKLKMQLFDDSYNFWFGNSIASGKHLLILVEDENYSKLDHRLVLSDVVHRDLTKDKMDFSSTLRVCDWKVINLLKTLPGTEATVEYLKMMRFLIEAFIEEKTPVSERLRKAFCVLHFFRSWCNNLNSRSNTTEKNFISKNCFESIEISVGFLTKLAKLGKAHLIHFCNSQECEKFFRNLRSMTSSGLTEINFSLYDCIKKIEKLQTMELFQNELEKEGFIFPQRYHLSSDSSTSSLDSIIDVDMADIEEYWSDEMLSVLYNESLQEIHNFNDSVKMSKGKLNLIQHFSYPNRSLMLKNQMKKFALRNYNIQEIDLEEVVYDDGEIIGQHVVIKNKRFLNEHSCNGNFKIMLDDGSHKKIPISKMLYLMQEDIERVSTDRLLRFQTNQRQEFKPTPIIASFSVRDYISIGEIVIASSLDGKETFLGIVLKFKLLKSRSDQMSEKSSKKFYFTTLIFQENKDVGFLIHPCYTLFQDGGMQLMEGYNELLKSDSYFCTINKSYVDFQNLKVDKDLLDYLRS